MLWQLPVRKEFIISLTSGGEFKGGRKRILVLFVKDGCGNPKSQIFLRSCSKEGVQPVTYYQKIARLTLSRLWQRYWTPNCSWCAGRLPSVCECMYELLYVSLDNMADFSQITDNLDLSRVHRTVTELNFTNRHKVSFWEFHLSVVAFFFIRSVRSCFTIIHSSFELFSALSSSFISSVHCIVGEKQSLTAHSRWTVLICISFVTLVAWTHYILKICWE